MTHTEDSEMNESRRKIDSALRTLEQAEPPDVSRYPYDPNREARKALWYAKVEGHKLRAIQITESNGSLSITTRYEFD